MSTSLSFSVRKTSSTKAILFVHGFGGESHQTFGMLPAFLAGDTALTDWDIHCFGYSTKLSPDITGVWAADPPISTLAEYLVGVVKDGRYSQYQELAIIAHSMGGLIVQQALLAGEFAERVRHVMLFGTPSLGLRKAGLGKLFKRQVRDMATGSVFITRLRQDWADMYPNALPFSFRAVAGVRDEFVPMDSSVDVFAQAYRSYVPGNHLEMVKPLTADEDIVLLVRKTFSTVLPANGVLFPSISQLDTYAQTVSRLENESDLSVAEVKEYVFALEMVGLQDRAIGVLETKHVGDSDLTGILAGRLKRRWLANPEEQSIEGQRSYELYRQGFEQAVEQLDYCQAFYHGINVAFLELALHESRYDARQMALRVLAQCRLAPRDKWQLATEGEVHLYLGDFRYALDCYAAALRSGPDPREVDSMYKQAIWSAHLLENSTVEKGLEQLFAPHITQ